MTQAVAAGSVATAADDVLGAFDLFKVVLSSHMPVDTLHEYSAVLVERSLCSLSGR